MARVTIDGYHIQGTPANRPMPIAPEVHTITGPGASAWNRIWVYPTLILGTLLLAWLILGQTSCGIHRNSAVIGPPPAVSQPAAPGRHNHPPVNIYVHVPPPQAQPAPAPNQGGASWLSCQDALQRQGIDPTGKCR